MNLAVILDWKDIQDDRYCISPKTKTQENSFYVKEVLIYVQLTSSERSFSFS